jgi:hypothetical protein
MSASTIVVHTQTEADAAFAAQTRDGVTRVTIIIDSTAGVWITIPNGGRADVNDGGWAAVNDGGWAAVNDGGWAAVNDGGRAAVNDGGWADVNRGGRADVNRGGRAAVNDGGRADVNDGGWADARAASTLNLYAGSTAKAGKYTAVFMHSQQVTLDGQGHIIDLTDLDLSDPLTWCEYHGVAVENGVAFVFKAVGPDWRSYYGADYAPGSTPEAADWAPTRIYGRGLHFGATPMLALRAAPFGITEPRFVKCGVRVDEMICLDDKVKARRVVVACVEVDRAGDVIEVAEVAVS